LVTRVRGSTLRRMRQCQIRFALCAALLLGPAARGAQAQPAPAVAVEVDPCVPVDHAKLHELLAIELGTSTAQGRAASAPTWVSVGCGPTGIELRVQDGVTRKSMARVLPSSSFSDASSTRLLALAIAEFVVASWIELSVQPAPAVEPVGPPAGESARRVAQHVIEGRAPQPPEPRVPSERTLSLGPAVQLWSAHDALLLGAGARVVLPLAELLVWTLSADFGAASVDVAYGELGLFTASLALALAVQARIDSVSFQLGPGGRIGFTRMVADPDPLRAEGDDFLAPYGGPIWLSRVVLRAGEHMRLALEAEVGLTTLPARAEIEGEGIALELDGVSMTSVVSLGWVF
jgi:hypothetical protein